MSEGGNSYDLVGKQPAERKQTRSRKLLGRYRHVIRLGLMVGAAGIDLCVIALSGMLVAFVRQGDLTSSTWLQTVSLLLPTYLLAALALHAYEMRSLRSFARAVFSSQLALGTAAAIAFSLAFALKVGEELSRLETGFTIVVVAVLLVAVRALGIATLLRFFRPVVEQRIVVLVDGIGTGRRAAGSMTTILDIRQADMVPALSDPAFFDRLGRVARDVDRVVVSVDDPNERLKWADAMRLSGLDAEIVADLGDVRPIALSNWQGHSTLVISRGPLNLGERLAKRAFDLVVTGALLVVLGPVIALFAVLVKLDSPGPAFFVQERVGRNNRKYRCYKLRSMRTDSNAANNLVLTARNDSRVTKLGRFIRMTSIDELPQLLNVLRGDMSLVGPRPHALGARAEGALYWELVPDYWSRHAMKPGVTGLAQVRGFRGATEQRTDIEHRVAADLEYINGWSLWLDVKILVMTARVAVHHNAY